MNNIYSNDTDQISHHALAGLKKDILSHAKTLGFQQVGVSDTHLGEHIERYQSWIEHGYHADLDYMERHGSKRWTANELEPGTLRVLSLRMDYMPDLPEPQNTLNKPDKAYISRYTLGRDYHKLIRGRLKKLITFIKLQADQYRFRAFVDSAPVLERAFAQKSGLGWFGKNTMIINRSAGSWFFLGEIYTDLPLPIDPPFTKEHCGSCTACLDTCPTNAFVGPYILDSKRCISYLTIEYKGSIPLELRSRMGNRVFGCDDCQIVCPWNRFSTPTRESDFAPRHQLDSRDLIDLFLWDEETFLNATEGSAIRRAGYESWQRNLAIALGNAPYSEAIVQALKASYELSTNLVKEHITWAINEQSNKVSN